jgi:hypothetical protein
MHIIDSCRVYAAPVEYYDTAPAHTVLQNDKIKKKTNRRYKKEWDIFLKLLMLKIVVK